MPIAPASPPQIPEPDRPSFLSRLRRAVVGAPRSLSDRRLFHRLTLVPFLAWVGLGADGLSSSCYGPDEAFRSLGRHTYLVLVLAVLMATTVVVIASAYSRIIEEFPHGGGGYVVATKLLGKHAGVVSGSALLVDYVLTIAVSIAGAGEAVFSFLPVGWHVAKVPAEVVVILGMILLNIRGVRESIVTLTPIFITFLITHVVAIVGGLIAAVPRMPALANDVGTGFAQGLGTLGVGGLLLLVAHAYSLGGGTYTGIEAVSNGLPIMREPRVQTGKRTMAYMAASLAFTASGLLVCYLLWETSAVHGKTMNAVLFERLTHGIPGGSALVIVTLLSEGALLVVAAQAGFLDGPRVLANMAMDSWVPRRFASLSERLTTQNGTLLMGGAALAVLVQTRGDLRHLVVMYSINVFLTFSMSMLGMARHTFRTRRERNHWKRRQALFVGGFLLCASILVLTTVEKFTEGGWLTVVVTATVILLCFFIHTHYVKVGAKLASLFDQLRPAVDEVPAEVAAPGPVDPSRPTAALLVAGFGGLGIHTLLNIFRAFPGHFENLVVTSVGVLGSGEFKGEGAVAELQARTAATAGRYVDLANRLGVRATARIAVGTDAVAEAERLCLEIGREFPQTTFFAGKVIFERERWYQRILHNETAFSIQTRLQWAGKTMVILPARVR